MKVGEEYEDGGDGHSVGVGRMCGRIDGLAGGQAVSRRPYIIIIA